MSDEIFPLVLFLFLCAVGFVTYAVIQAISAGEWNDRLTSIAIGMAVGAITSCMTRRK